MLMPPFGTLSDVVDRVGARLLLPTKDHEIRGGYMIRYPVVQSVVHSVMSLASG